MVPPGFHDAQPMAFDNTYTDQEFKRRLEKANDDWIAKAARREPDLTVDGLRGSLIARLLALFGAKAPR